jgi:hypothetical protein
LSSPFDARAIECVDHFHQHIDNAAHRPSLAPIRWMAGKDSRQRGERFLVNAQERARCPHPKGCDQRSIYICKML